MKTFFCLFILMFISSFSIADTFKIDSYYYTDSAPKPNYIGSNIVFNVDTEVSCEGQLTNKIFVSKDSFKQATTSYNLTRFWPSYFLRQAALSDSEIRLDLGRYDATLEACEVGFKYEGSGQQRWYEPHEFNVSDTEDTNPINKVYYQLFINVSRPSFSPWVYADTDYSVTCDGITTNRVIPTTNPNEFGNIVLGEYGSQVSPYYSSENTRSFFDLLNGKIEQYTVGRYIPQIGGCTIYNVEFSENSISSAAIELGKQQCIDAPETCDLFSRDEIDSAIGIGLEEGIAQCINSPESCDLFDQTDVDSSFSMGNTQGIESCISNPETCGLFDELAINDANSQGISEGEQRCQNDPALCGLFGPEALESAFINGESEGIRECKDNPASCGLFSETKVNEAFIAGEVSGKELGKQLGKENCVNNPSSCELFNLEDVNTKINERLSASLKDVALSLPKGVLKSICKKQPNSDLCAYYDGHHKHKYYKKLKYYKDLKYYKKLKYRAYQTYKKYYRYGHYYGGKHH